MAYEEPKRLVTFLSLALWVYRASKHTSTLAMSFFLVYWAKGVVPVEVIIPPARLALASKLADPYNRIYDVEPSRKGDIHSKQTAILEKTDQQSLQ